MGLGDSSDSLSYPTASQMTSAINSGISTANSTGSAVAGGVAAGLSVAAASTAAVCPPCSAAFALGSALTGIITKMAQGCGPTCVDASNYVNEVEPYFLQNVQNYASTPIRTKSFQALHLSNFDNAYNALVQKCQQIGGAGGTNCIKDRQSGACKWKASPWVWNSDGTLTLAGPAGSGSQCWNWVYGYRDAIAQDPYAVADDYSTGSAGSAAGSSAISALTSSSSAVGGVPLVYLLLGGLALWAVMK